MLSFKGSLEELKQIIEKTGENGQWTELGNGSHQMKTTDGGFINWWPSNGRVNCQGKCKGRLDAVMQAALDNPGVSLVPQPGKAPAPRGRKIFIVHGHDVESRDQLELSLHRLGLDPFVLMNSSGGGKTIIEALEGKIGRDFTSDFGIALFTPDDTGYSVGDGPVKAEPRGRQNVVLETGMLLASLTRDRMAILVKGHVDLPSDLQGIIQLRFNVHVKEIMGKLCSRLQEAGIEVDAARIASVT